MRHSQRIVRCILCSCLYICSFSFAQDNNADTATAHGAANSCPASTGEHSILHPVPWDVLASAGLLVGGKACFDHQLNEQHPLFSSDVKSYEPQSISEGSVTGGVFMLSMVPFVFEHGKGLHHFRGYLLSSSACFFLYGFTSSAAGRLRPNYDDAIAHGMPGEKKSYFSGHATMSFAAATYTTLYLRGHAETALLPACAGAVLYAAATYVAYTRVNEHYHHVSDVVTGAAVGTIVSFVTYRWYEKTEKKAAPLQARLNFRNGNEVWGTLSYTFR